ncbi:phosphohistidine phosphatase SixA [Pseudomonas oryzae]|uniref:Phosphohistidine phosphatase, SixA n=1 Tax=Pseudomonas oryzae TaxID=1392877 RepID=A0A1H1S3K9_9PSED|nr:phosphohistidine phosphatase SixA [Pseudomonas oryzae]SDS42587.1 phosphohistidine phosphatase, SixA [Pseudomonas oryzae]
MRLWLLRHGQAGPYVHTGDHLRELTERGRQEALHAAGHLLGEELDAILVSPYVRAQQTADLVHGALGRAAALITLDGITPDDDPREALRVLAERRERNLLVVSHQPLLGALAGLLVHGHLQQPVVFNTATLALLEGEMPLAGLMDLRALHHPPSH